MTIIDFINSWYYCAPTIIFACILLIMIPIFETDKLMIPLNVITAIGASVFWPITLFCLLFLGIGKLIKKYKDSPKNFYVP